MNIETLIPTRKIIYLPLVEKGETDYHSNKKMHMMIGFNKAVDEIYKQVNSVEYQED